MRHIHVPANRPGSVPANRPGSVPRSKPKRGGNYQVQRVEKVNVIKMDTTRRGPSAQVELSFSARNLANRDFTSKSDPICIIYRPAAQPNAKPKEIARTEMIRDNLSPDWTKRIKIEYYFESKQPLLFKIFDIDCENGALQDQDFLGAARCDLADIVAAPNSYLTMKLDGAHFVRGDIIVHAQEIDQGQRETLCLNVHVSELAKKSFFCSLPNAFLEFYRFLDDGTKHLALRTSVRDNTASASWNKLEITLKNLCDGNKDREFLIECYDYSYTGSSPSFIGSARTTVCQLLESQPTRLQIVRQRSAGKKPPEKLTGRLAIDGAQVRIDYTFLDYITGGLQLEFAACVDFTASNGQPHSTTSLHYIDSRQPNQYEMAIRSVLEICQHYNQRKVFEATGFGARIPPSQHASHLFPLDLTQKTRNFVGVEGVVQAYRDCIKRVELYGPTHFAPSIIEFVLKAQRMPADGRQYQILLILTDGAIGDMSKTKDLIIQASELPISIIIIGVGNDTFEKMDQLDSDNALLRHNGRQAKRDIVQFVPFNQFVPANGHFADEEAYMETMRLLAKEVLAEVPEQVTSYMRLHGLKPGQTNFNGFPNAPFQQPIGGLDAPIPQSNANPAPYPQNVHSVPYPQLPNEAPYPQQSNAMPYPQQPSTNPAYPPADQYYDASKTVIQQTQKRLLPENPAQNSYGLENLHLGNGTTSVKQPGDVPTTNQHIPPTAPYTPNV